MSQTPSGATPEEDGDPDRIVHCDDAVVLFSRASTRVQYLQNDISFVHQWTVDAGLLFEDNIHLKSQGSEENQLNNNGTNASVKS